MDVERIMLFTWPLDKYILAVWTGLDCIVWYMSTTFWTKYEKNLSCIKAKVYVFGKFWSFFFSYLPNSKNWEISTFFFSLFYLPNRDRLCGLVVRVHGYRVSGPRFNSWRYQIFWVVVGLEEGPFRLVSTTEELLGRKSSGSGLERYTPYLQKLALTSLSSGSRSVSVVCLRTKATEFSISIVFTYLTAQIK
jgi:hypothetical protein